MVATAQVSVLGLTRAPLLAGLAPDRLQDIAARCHWRRFEPGQVIIARNAAAGDVHLVIDGRVRIHVYGADGREVLFTQVQEGALVGDLAAVDGGLRSTDAHASTQVLTASLSSADFKQLLREEPKVEERYVRYLVGLVRSLTNRVIELSTLDVQNRVRAELLRLARAAGHEQPSAVLAPAPRHADLAARVGTTREQVTRELSSLARQGLVEKRGGALVVPDLRRLQSIVAGSASHA